MKNILEKLMSIHDWLTEIAAVLAAIGLISIVTFYVYEVVTRYMFNSPTAWVSDFVSYALAASVFLALPKVTKEKGHVAVTIIVDVIPTRIADFVHTIISLIGFACLSLATYISFQENLRQFTKNIETLAIIPVPQWWISSFITFGLALSSLYMLRYAPPSQRNVESHFSGSAG
ncbi:MAG: TRAP transporter small permease [Hyphomicrobiales bacterium]|nr:TRAP transporter small permease [Hyphomicrobiales bacterium]